MDAQEHWQPKITPYRCLVLFSTIVLGGVKAYAVSQNLNLVATSIEWIAGVVVFSTLFIIGLCEPNPPRLLEWLLLADLVPIVFRKFSLNPPRYRSDERLNRPQFPFTGYRLLSSVSVALFGTLKAYFTYRNKSSAANAVDWSFGIIIVSSLYILGLYENNPANIMPLLFSVDCFVVVEHLLHLTGICLALAVYGLGISSNLLKFPPPFALNEIRNFGRDLVFFGFFFLAPFSSIIVLSFRLLAYSLKPFSNPRNFVFGNFNYALSLKQWPKWMKLVPIRFSFLVMCEFLFFFTVSAVATGFSFILLDNLPFGEIFEIYDTPLSYFITPLTFLIFSYIILLCFGNSAIFFFKAIRCILWFMKLSD